MQFLIEDIEKITDIEIKRIYEESILKLQDLGVPISVYTTLKIHRRQLNKSQKSYKAGTAVTKDGNYTINIFIFGNETRDDIVNTMYHELLHTIPNGMTHTGKWKAWADVLNRRLGLNIQRTHNKFSEEEYNNLENNPRYKYKLTCSKCGRSWYFTRETKLIKRLKSGDKYAGQCPYDYGNLIINNINESFEEIKDIDYYIDNRILSKFDKWLGYDCGPIRYDPSEDKDYYYDGIWEESWTFVGRQSDKLYYFYCTSAPYNNKEMEGQVLKFKTFKEATYQIAFPGRNY